MSPAVYLVLTTCADRAAAERLGQALVDERLVACATALPEALSLYTWQGRGERAAECLLLLKTAAPRLAELERRLHELHPYDTPEFVALEAARVADAYAAWVAESTAPPA